GPRQLARSFKSAEAGADDHDTRPVAVTRRNACRPVRHRDLPGEVFPQANEPRRANIRRVAAAHRVRADIDIADWPILGDDCSSPRPRGMICRSLVRERALPITQIPPVLIADSVTRVGADAAGAVVINGSHGGIYAAYSAAKLRVAA